MRYIIYAVVVVACAYIRMRRGSLIVEASAICFSSAMRKAFGR